MNREKINIDFNLNNINTKNIKPKKIESESSSLEEESDNEKDYKNKVNNEIFSLEEKKEENENINSEIFNYDKIYDQIQLEKKIKKEKEKKNSSQIKYMNKILEKAELRRIERNKNILKVEKEQYKKETGRNLDDLPSFITKSYQKKLDKVNSILNNNDNNNSFFDKKDDINLKDFEKRKKEYQRNLKKFDEDQIKKIVNRERIINNYQKEKKISEKTEINENLTQEEKIKAYKERYLQRKREKTE